MHQPNPDSGPANLPKYGVERRERRRERSDLRVPANDNSLALNLNIRPQRQLLDRHAGAAGLDVSPVLFVSLVHLAEQRHVREEDVHFEDGLEVAVGCEQDRGEVLDYAVLLLGKKRERVSFFDGLDGRRYWEHFFAFFFFRLLVWFGHM